MDNLRGAVLMVFAMACFAIEDLFIKGLTGDLSVGVVLVLLGLGGGTIFAVIAAMQGRSLLDRALWRRALLLRNAGEMIGTMGFVTAIALTPLSSASAILQANPLAVTLGAALFLNEQVGWRRWTAICIGFIGVLMVVRPGLEGFEPASLFAVQGVIGLAIRDLATRAAPPAASSMQISALGFYSVAPVGLALIVLTGQAPMPTAAHALPFGVALMAGVTGYYAIVAAMRVGDVSFVTPFRYTRLIFAMGIGMVILNERPDLWTWAGAALIVGSGLYTLIREARLNRKTRRAAKLAATLEP